MIDQRSAGFAETGDDVEHARGNSRFQRQFRKAQRRKWRLFSRLENDCATCGQRRRNLPGRHRHRIIPGNDQTTDTHRLADGVIENLGTAARRDRQRFSAKFGRPAGKITKGFDRPFNFDDLRERRRLSVVDTFQHSQLRRIPLNQIGEPVQQQRAVNGAHVAPGRIFQRLAGGFHSQVNISHAALCNLTNFFAGCGVDRSKGLARLRLYRLAINDQALRPF